MSETLSLKNILNEILKKDRSLLITLPSSVTWKEYEKELRKAANWKYVLNFKVYNYPNGVHKGDKCYVIHNGLIKGWMEIVGFKEKEFTCSSTNKKWQGKFVEQSGPFHYLNEKIPYKDFQGFRYFDLQDYKLQNKLNNEYFRTI